MSDKKEVTAGQIFFIWGLFLVLGLIGLLFVAGTHP